MASSMYLCWQRNCSKCHCHPYHVSFSLEKWILNIINDSNSLLYYSRKCYFGSRLSLIYWWLASSTDLMSVLIFFCPDLPSIIWRRIWREKRVMLHHRKASRNTRKWWPHKTYTIHYILHLYYIVSIVMMMFLRGCFSVPLPCCCLPALHPESPEWLAPWS